MTLSELQRRDARIAELEDKGRAGRTGDEEDELGRLWNAQENHLRRLPAALARARQRAAELETYARQHRLLLEIAA